MEKLSLEQYILDVKTLLANISKLPIDGSGRVFELKFTNTAFQLEGKIVVTFSVPGGKINVKASYYDYVGNKKDSITIKDMSPLLASTQIDAFIKAKESEITTINKAVKEFRDSLWEDNLKPLGFSRECDSKYLVVFTNDIVTMTFKFKETEYTAEITKHKKPHGSKVYQFTGKVVNIPNEYTRVKKAYQLVKDKQ